MRHCFALVLLSFADFSLSRSSSSPPENDVCLRTSDTVILSVVRAILVPVLLVLSIKAGNPLAAVQRLSVERRRQTKLDRSYSSKSNTGGNVWIGLFIFDFVGQFFLLDDQPLLAAQDLESGKLPKAEPSDDAEITEKEKKVVKKSAEYQKNIYLVPIFPRRKIFASRSE